MTTDRWRRINDLFLAALEHSASEREAFLARECGDDATLLGEVRSLLAADEKAGDFLERSPIPPGPATGPTSGSDSGMLTAGSRLGPYEIVSLLGKGGMGEVYRARDPRLERDVAVKVLPAEVGRDAERLARFNREARAAGALNHPNILAVYDTGDHEGRPYVVTELLEGETLRERLRGAALPVRKAVEYGIQIARGLAAAHERGIVHRDLKPENVFLTRDGHVKILDFGLAKVTRTDSTGEGATATATRPGVVMGTVGYMSPEQVRGEAVDHRSDIFSLGVVLYEMLSGRRAFLGVTAVEVMNAILTQDPPDLAPGNPAIGPALEQLVLRCLDKRPAERVQSARDLAFHLEMLSGAAGTVTAARWPMPSRTPLRVGAAMAAVVALVVAGWLAGRAGRPDRGSSPEFHQLTFLRGHLHRARFGADPQTVVYYAAWGQGRPVPPAEIYVGRVDRPEARRLGSVGTLLDVSSKDEALVLGWRTARHGPLLSRLSLEGGAARDLLEGVEEADWAPDGEQMAIIRAGDRDRLEYPVGTVLHEGLGLALARLSPDGQRVAFVEHPQGASLVVVARLKKRRELQSGWATVTGVAWAPRGDEVWFSGAKVAGEQNALYAVSLSGALRTILRLPSPLRLDDIAPDGRVLIVQKSIRVEMWGRLAGEAQERDHSWLGYGHVAGLSVDGTRMLFAEYWGGKAGRSAYLWRAGDAAPVRLAGGRALALSPDGAWALVLDQDANRLQLVPTGAGEVRPLDHEGLRPTGPAAFLPDGKSILFDARDAGGHIRTYVLALDGGPCRPVTREGAAPNAVAPDGASFVGDDFRLYSLRDGEPRSISGLERGMKVVGGWRADGHALYALGYDGTGDSYATIAQLETTTGKRTAWRDLELRDGAGLAGCQALAVTPDGASYAYSCVRDLSTLYLVEGLR